MEIKVVYKTPDGKQFETKQEASDHIKTSIERALLKEVIIGYTDWITSNGADCEEVKRILHAVAYDEDLLNHILEFYAPKYSTIKEKQCSKHGIMSVYGQLEKCPVCELELKEIENAVEDD